MSRFSTSPPLFQMESVEGRCFLFGHWLLRMKFVIIKRRENQAILLEVEGVFIR